MSIFDFFKNKKKTISFDEIVKYSGGDGSSPANAVVITAPISSIGVHAEYVYLRSKFGRQNVDFQIQRQSLELVDNKHYDVFTIQLSDGSIKKIFFDISNFFKY